MGKTRVIIITYIILLSIAFTTCGRNKRVQQSGHSSAGQSSQSSGQGSSQVPQPCGFLKRVECPEPTNLTDGTVVYSGRGFKDSVNYSCNTGYELVGFPTRICLSDESWSGAMPTCVFAGCGYESLLASDNGQIVYTGNMIDDTANVTCDRGYTLTGVGFWSCLVTGWDGSDGQCDPNTCRTLTNPTGESVTAPAGPVFEDEAVYSCNPGYELSGYNRRWCLSDREWSGDAQTCVPSESTTIIICENDRETISCSGPSDVISITYANYGRTSPDPTICPHAQISNTNCGTGDESDQQTVMDLCDWQTSCELFASNSVFGDPCQGTYKYLEVTYFYLEE